MAPAIEVVTAYLRAFSVGDPDSIANMVAPGFRSEHHSALGSDCEGRTEYRRRLPHFLEAFHDPRYEIGDLVTQERDAVTDVVVRYLFTGTYGDTRVEIPGVMWFTVRDELITKRVDTWDSLTFLQQTEPSEPSDPS